MSDLVAPTIERPPCRIDGPLAQEVRGGRLERECRLEGGHVLGDRRRHRRSPPHFTACMRLPGFTMHGITMQDDPETTRSSCPCGAYDSMVANPGPMSGALMTAPHRVLTIGPRGTGAF